MPHCWQCHTARYEQGMGRCSRNWSEYFNIGVCRGRAQRDRVRPRSVRRSIFLRSLSSSASRPSGGPLASSVRPTEQMFVPSPRASARRAEAGRSRARVGLRVGRDSRATPAPPAENLPTAPLRGLAPGLAGGERVHRVLRTKTSDRGAWDPWQDGGTVLERRAWSPAHSRDFCRAHRESAFPPLRQDPRTGREVGRAARLRELRQWRRWGNCCWPGGGRAEHGRSGRATSL